MKKNEKLDVQIGTKMNTKNISVEIIPNGPYLVKGNPKLVQHLIVANSNKISIKYEEGKLFDHDAEIHLCRCGLSNNKPFCDGAHKLASENGIDLTENASFEPSLTTSEEIDGPIISLTDDEKLCAFGRFCDNGQQIWNEVQNDSKESVDMSIEMAHRCPAGRLLVWDNETQKPIETEEEPVVGIIEDVPLKCSGPIALRGGIPVQSSTGYFYELRMRQALCRCGMSNNKPFCNGAHASIKFQDGLPKVASNNGKTI